MIFCILFTKLWISSLEWSKREWTFVQYIRTLREQIYEARDMRGVPLLVVGNKQDKLSSAVAAGNRYRDIVNLVRKHWRCGYVECSARFNCRVVQVLCIYVSIRSGVLNHFLWTKWLKSFILRGPCVMMIKDYTYIYIFFMTVILMYNRKRFFGSSWRAFKRSRGGHPRQPRCHANRWDRTPEIRTTSVCFFDISKNETRIILTIKPNRRNKAFTW